MRKKSFIIVGMCVLAVFFSCSKSAPTVDPADFSDTTGGTTPGYNYPSIIAVEPTAGVSPTNTRFIFRFNIPVNGGDINAANILVSSANFGAFMLGSDFTVTVNAANPTAGYIIFLYNAAHAGTTSLSPLLQGDIITVSFTAGIRDFESGNNIVLSNPGAYSFTIDPSGAPDETAPTFLAASQSPADLATNVALNTAITINFSETIDLTTINTATFYLTAPGPVLVPCSRTYAGVTATLTPDAPLNPNVIYTVHLVAGVRDLSGNNLAAGIPHTWAFTTINAITDPVPGAPSFTDQPSYTAIAMTSALASWSTSESANYIFRYGRGDTVASTIVDPDTTALFSMEDCAVPGLTAGKRYYMQVHAYDKVGDSIGHNVDSTIIEFNTLTNETATAVASGAGVQNSLRTVQNTFGVTNSGFFTLWSDGSGYLYGQRYTNTLAAAWGATGIFTGSAITYGGAAEDETGGILVAVVNGGNVYTKRLTAAGAIFDWGAGTTAADPGYQVNTAGSCSSVQVAPVYHGIISNITSGTTEQVSAATGYLFNNTTDFSLATAATTGDYAYNATVTNSAATVTTQTFSYILGLSASIFSNGDAFIIGQSPGSNLTARNHAILVTPGGTGTAITYTSSGTDIYTDHSVAVSFYSTNDIISSGGNYGLVSVFSSITPNGSSFLTGTNTAPGASQLIDTTFPPFILSNTGKVVWNSDDNLYAIATYSSPSVLNLSANIFTAAPRNYSLFQNEYCNTHLSTDPFGVFRYFTADWAIGITNGNAFTVYNSIKTGTAQTVPANPLYDNTAMTYANNDIAINYTNTYNMARVVSASSYTHALSLSNSAALADNNAKNYNILRLLAPPTTDVEMTTSVRTYGTITSAGTTHLIDSVNSFASVQPGDVIYNITQNQSSTVRSVAVNDLTLTSAITNAVGNRYVVIRERGALYVWVNGGNIEGRIISMDRNPPVVLRNTFTIVAGNSPHLVSDGHGNVFVVHFNTSTNTIRTYLIDATGNLSIVRSIRTTADATSSILKVIPDGVGGIVVLFKHGAGNTLRAQWIQNDLAGNLTRAWGNDGVLIVAATTPTVSPGSDIAFYYNTGTPANSHAVITYETAGTIYACRVNNSVINWGPTIISNATGTQQSPSIVLNNGGTDAYISWDDNRFSSRIGYGIFIQHISSAGGSLWTANSGGTADTNGCAAVLQHENTYWMKPQIVLYNNGAGSRLIWEDYRNGIANATDLLMGVDVFTFTP